MSPKTKAPASSLVDESQRKPGQRLHGSGYSDQAAPKYEDAAEDPGYDIAGKRLDGPSFQKWVDDGNQPHEYPPQSYADLRVVDPETGLRIDGPTYDEWTKSGKAADAYPPAGFADRRDVMGDFDEEGYLLDREGQRVAGKSPLSEDQRKQLQQQHDERANRQDSGDEDRDLRVDEEGFELDSNGDRIPDREPLSQDEIRTRRQEDQERRMRAAQVREARRPGDTIVDESRGAVDRPGVGALGGARAGAARGAGGRFTGSGGVGQGRGPAGSVAAGQMQPVDPVTGLRTDGPTLEEYVQAGRDANSYPPMGYADKRKAAGEWPDNVPADQRTPPAPASSVLSSGDRTGEAVEYGSTQGQEQTGRASENERG